MTISSVKTGAIGDSLLAGNAAFIPTSFESIASATGTGSSGNITFSSIPSTYTSLQIRLIGRDGAGTGTSNFGIQINSDTGSNYTRHNLRGNGTSATAGGSASTSSISGTILPLSNQTANTMGVSIVDIHDYASTSKYKTVRIFGGVDLNGSGTVSLESGLWMSTSAITSITLIPGWTTWTTNTTIALYGIKG
jgi:hypothetical protein